MRAEGEVVDVETVSLTYSGCFLTYGEVSRSGVVVFDAVVNALRFDFVEHRFELADDSHISVDTQKILFLVDFLFFGKCFVLLTKRDLIKFYKAFFECVLGADVLTLWHSIIPSFCI